ncbi:uncharacterized protein TRIADDRAFT_32096 [Trichoplax adhaerens]|uniref:non-specific serine/threonine protein kinase n=1 Tax=Trichoplax adhaerens TaxID=10228 RepID=B3SA46_TRIAD|nr:hypothetical protein TRIADDRAFT_32096 [Trichoplax adhaerens]EDV20456.1 hypothetical protein TRIADDRAFT_32096 [Trichoplax adhaerens]|eukprot:XP_002117150.1 hypothetical protein TRIADDRAFT_32096 [Trichoplax adhaerens]
MISSCSFKKLSEESLTRPPEEVFDLLEKLGEGSYGTVYKAVHKETGQLLAVKKVPVDSDLQDIIREISIMQQCDCSFVVKYFGSYFENSYLWIVMEFCGGGSVLDIMRLRQKTLEESKIATIVRCTLKGLEYLHILRKIHRDVKAGNILLDLEGNAKLADFGVAGQLTDTMAKRNTVIGTPFWMAPEVIQAIGYDCAADIWSLGITAIEMAEGRPPYADIHPMRAIFMIPTKPPPTFQEPDKWSTDFIDFVSKCLVKVPEQRPSASALLQHNFVKNAMPVHTLQGMIKESQEALLARPPAESDSDTEVVNTEEEDEIQDVGTMVKRPTSTHIAPEDDIDSGTGTMICKSDTMVTRESPLVADDSDMSTLVISNANSKDYKPDFMEHFDKINNNKSKENLYEQVDSFENFGFLKQASYQDLQDRLANLDVFMEKDLEELRKRYQTKRQPILEAIEAKKRQQKLQDHKR